MLTKRYFILIVYIEKSILLALLVSSGNLVFVL